MTEKTIKLMWKRPESADFPKIWSKFCANDANTDEMIEYRIQDLPESRFQNGVEFMVQQFCQYEPLSEAFGTYNDKDAVDDFKFLWNLIFKQKMALACFKSDTDEIVGMNANYVKCKADNFMEQLQHHIKSKRSLGMLGAVNLLRQNLDKDVYEQYGVDAVLGSLGLVVDKNYARRGIGEQLLRCRDSVCKEFQIKLTSTLFTSDASIRIVDKIGFTTDIEMKYDDFRIKYPHVGLPPVKSSTMAVKSKAY